MTVFNMHEAKTHLSRLVERAEAGEEIIIARSGKPLVRLVPFNAGASPRTPGRLKGKLTVTADFDETPSWVLDAFEGRPGAQPAG